MYLSNFPTSTAINKSHRRKHFSFQHYDLPVLIGLNSGKAKPLSLGAKTAFFTSFETAHSLKDLTMALTMTDSIHMTGSIGNSLIAKKKHWEQVPHSPKHLRSISTQ